MAFQTSTDYGGRLVDLECFQTEAEPAGALALDMTLRGDGKSRKVTGIQKLVQRYLITFMTTIGDVKFAQDQGTDFVISVLQGVIQNRSAIVSLFAFADSETQAQLDLDDSEDMPDDERLDSAELLDYDIDQSAGKLYLKVQLNTVAEDAYTFIIPT